MSHHHYPHPHLHHHAAPPPPHYYRKKRGSTTAGFQYVAGPLRHLVDEEEDVNGIMGGGSSRDASEEDNDAFSEASDSASSFRPHHSYPTRSGMPTLSHAAGPSLLSNHGSRRPHTQSPPLRNGAYHPQHSLGNATSSLASSSSTDLAQYGADDEGKGQPIPGAGGGAELQRFDSIGSSSTGSLAPHDVAVGEKPRSTSGNSKRLSQGAATGLSLGSLPSPDLRSVDQTPPQPNLTSASATPLAVPTPTPRQMGSRPKRTSRSKLDEDYLAFQYESGQESDCQAPSEASSFSSVNNSRPIHAAASGIAFTRAANKTDSEGHRSGSDTDRGTASPYDGDVEFAARTPVSMQVTNMNSQAVSSNGNSSGLVGNAASGGQPVGGGTLNKDHATALGFTRQGSVLTSSGSSAPISPSQLSHALAAASVSSHGASADIESSVESSSPPFHRSSHRQTITSPAAFMGASKGSSTSAPVKDVPTRVYSSGATLIGRKTPSQAEARQAFMSDEENTTLQDALSSKASNEPSATDKERAAEPDCKVIMSLMQSLNSRSKLNTLLKDGHSAPRRTPLKIYVQTSFDVPTLEDCSRRLRTAKLCRSRADSAGDVIVIAGVMDNASHDGSAGILPLQQRATLARNCRWVDEVVEGVPTLNALEQSSGAVSTDSAEQLQIQRILKDVGADCAARFCRVPSASNDQAGSETLKQVEGSSSTGEEMSKILALPLF
ncbi:unnamed protein product [Sympodiomycopsis kandeliae]